jgi:antitoxin component YwqK of YwqJK toxin-antitoxin module
MQYPFDEKFLVNETFWPNGFHKSQEYEEGEKQIIVTFNEDGTKNTLKFNRTDFTDLHSPTHYKWFKSGNIDRVFFYKNGNKHSLLYPAAIYFYDEDGKKINKKEWYVDGMLHNSLDAAVQIFNKNGKLVKKEYYINGKSITEKVFNKIFVECSDKNDELSELAIKTYDKYQDKLEKIIDNISQ